ncbi:hypothetical protein SCUP234_10089 [Seiridium cupressi]
MWHSSTQRHEAATETGHDETRLPLSSQVPLSGRLVKWHSGRLNASGKRNGVRVLYVHVWVSGLGLVWYGSACRSNAVEQPLSSRAREELPAPEAGDIARLNTRERIAGGQWRDEHEFGRGCKGRWGEECGGAADPRAGGGH